MKKIKSIIIKEAKARLPQILRLLGTHLLSKPDTFKRLERNEIFLAKSETIEIAPDVVYGGDIAEVTKKHIVQTSSVRVFHLKSPKQLTILPYGGVKLENKVLDMDLGNSLYVKNLFSKDKRKIVLSKNCIVLWSHYWGSGYYDFLFFIYAKFLRIKAVIGDAAIKESVVVYPLFRTAFEKELWSYAGLSEEQLLNSRNFNVKASDYYLSSNDSWFFPHPGQVSLLAQAVQIIPSVLTKSDERIFILRKGRRILKNEVEIIEAVKEFGFKIVEDIPRTVLEQMRIYQNAKVILGPHGAAFSNILWCMPGTILIEMFPNNYYPPYYRYLAQVLNLDYYCVVEEGVEVSHYSNLDKDIFIDLAVIKSALNDILRS